MHAVTVFALVVAAFIGVWFSLELGGAGHANEFGDPGALVRWGGPLISALVSLSGAVTIGGLATILFVLPPGAAFERVHSLALVASVVWTTTVAAHIVFSYFTVVGTPIAFDESFESTIPFFLTETDLGRLLLAILGMTAFTTVLIALSRHYFGVAGAFLVAVATAWPFAELSHSGTPAQHGIAVNALVLHIVFVSLWSGGLVAAVVAMVSGANRSDTLRRYSSVALLSISIVAITGVASAIVRVGTFDNLVSEYGIIVLLKAVATVILALLGVRWRRRVIPRLETMRGLFAFAALETAILGFVVGLATGLARTAPPVASAPSSRPSPAEILTGRPLPPEWSWTTAFTEWSPDLIWGLFAVFTTVFYLWGVTRLRRRGDAWPVHRSVAWILGMTVLVYATSGGVAVYGQFLFSAHMMAHMVLTMLVPVGIVLAAPVTLVARAIEVRRDGSKGMREWILGIVQSRWVGLVGHPLVATVVFAVSLLVFYYSPLLSWATTTHLGHEWMILHFLLSGYLFIQALAGVDPSPHRTSYPMRLILLMGTMGFHAFFGLSLMTGEAMLLPEWFGAMGRTWGDPPLVDQQVGGAIAWGIGELPTLILSGLVIVSWIRSDEREAKRLDRQATRNHDADLDEYNQWLGRLNDRAR